MHCIYTLMLSSFYTNEYRWINVQLRYINGCDNCRHNTYTWESKQLIIFRIRRLHLVLSWYKLIYLQENGIYRDCEVLSLLVPFLISPLWWSDRLRFFVAAKQSFKWWFSIHLNILFAISIFTYVHNVDFHCHPKWNTKLTNVVAINVLPVHRFKK